MLLENSSWLTESSLEWVHGVICMCAVLSGDILQGKHYMSWHCNQSNWQTVHPGTQTGRVTCSVRPLYCLHRLSHNNERIGDREQNLLSLLQTSGYEYTQTHKKRETHNSWVTASAQHLTPCESYHGNLSSTHCLCTSQERGQHRHLWLLLMLSATRIGSLSLRPN